MADNNSHHTILRFVLGLLILSCSALLASCDSKVFYAAERDVDEHGWNLNDGLLFKVDVDDTLQIFDFFVDVRNNTRYDKANLFLFINTTFPDGSIAHDTLECPLADVEGHWYGNKTGRYVDSRYVLRRNVLFPRKGQYLFDIYHGMRDTNISNLKSVGLRIEKVKGN